MRYIVFVFLEGESDGGWSDVLRVSTTAEVMRFDHKLRAELAGYRSALRLFFSDEPDHMVRIHVVDLRSCEKVSSHFLCSSTLAEAIGDVKRRIRLSKALKSKPRSK